VLVEGSQLIKVVNIIYHNLEQLLLFKLVGHIKALDPFGTKVIHDDLRHSQQRPHVTSSLVQDGHAIRAREGVHVGQPPAAKGQSQGLTQVILAI